MTGKKAGLRFQWEQRLREAKLSKKAKHIGHLMATYANADGTKVHPGIRLLETGSGWGRRSTIDALEELREVGFIEKTRESNSWAGRADEYRLVIPTGFAKVGAPSVLPGSGAGARSATRDSPGAGTSTPPDQHQIITKSGTDQQGEQDRIDAIWDEVEKQAAAEKEERAKREAEVQINLLEVPSFD